MVGPSSPMFLPLAHSAATASPRRHEERHRTRDLTPLHPHPDICLSTVPSNSGSPNLATEFRVGSPVDVTSPTTVGASAYAGSDDDDIGMCDTEANNSHQQSEGISLSASAKTAIERATKRFRSQCWKEFEPVLEDGVVVQGRCKHCDIVMAAKRGAGTSSLLTHLRRCKKRDRNLRIVQDLSSTLRSPCGSSLKDWSYDPDISRYELMRMISLHGLPFLCLEYDGLRRFVASLNPLFKVPYRTTGRTGCLKAFHDMKLELKEIVQKFDKYWNKSYVLLCVPVVFDPRYKLKFIGFLFKESFQRIIFKESFPSPNRYHPPRYAVPNFLLSFGVSSSKISQFSIIGIN